MALPLSVLDLAPIASGSTPSQAFRNTVDLARLADRLGYTRYWLAEHHGLPSVASSAPEILIEHVASATPRIRVGSGGIMLPNHAPPADRRGLSYPGSPAPGADRPGDRPRAGLRPRHVAGDAPL
jgi:hypothetical protein